MNFRSPNSYTNDIVTKIMKDFLKKEERLKGFFIFVIFYIVSLLICYSKKHI